MPVMLLIHDQDQQALRALSSCFRQEKVSPTASLIRYLLSLALFMLHRSSCLAQAWHDVHCGNVHCNW